MNVKEMAERERENENIVSVWELNAAERRKIDTSGD